VNGHQFALTWATLWLFGHVNFQTLDVFTIWLPAPFVPMALITWVVFNVVSILVPFELSPGFYRWAYVMPAHETFQVLINIWSGGCNPTLRYSLPILFSLEISSTVLSALGVHRRAHYAIIKADLEKEAFQIRLDAAVAFETKRLEEERRKTRLAGSRASSEIVAGGENSEDVKEQDREEMADVIRQEENEIRRIQTKADGVNFGPSFGFPMGNQDDNDP